ncbi:HlyD family secretion protein [Pectinatus brassicae]|uniref:Multidrug resistance efflux pump n=1 Tax=Pectinatus brassicae TaxID=862415 RepID=A0A840UKQ9_9FIRM|nr:biotin/lipoyl-binding protein [Pectinatus brassicae]MBB5335298.1 multidrug resistance efflux pump [Pectinatus brassicae]
MFNKLINTTKKRMAFLILLFLILLLPIPCIWLYFNFTNNTTILHNNPKNITVIPITAKINSRIIEINVDDGTKIKKGMILARLDDSNLQSQLKKAQQNLLDAKADLQAAQTPHSPAEQNTLVTKVDESVTAAEKARADFDSASALYQKNLIDKAQLDTKQQELTTAQNKLTAAEQNYKHSTIGNRPEDITYYERKKNEAMNQVNSLYTQINDTVIRASSNGIVNIKNAQVGQQVHPDLTLFNIVVFKEI